MADEIFQNPDERPVNAEVRYTPPPAGQPASAPAQDQAVPERWAFNSRTIQRLTVAGIMFYVAQNHAGLIPYLPQDLAADTVSMVFNLFGTVFLGWAGRGRQIGANTGPERIYWLPRRRAA